MGRLVRFPRNTTSTSEAITRGVVTRDVSSSFYLQEKVTFPMIYNAIWSKNEIKERRGDAPKGPNRKRMAERSLHCEAHPRLRVKKFDSSGTCAAVHPSYATREIM
jgi:hypothetical protein